MIAELLGRSPLTEESQRAILRLEVCIRSEAYIDIMAQQKPLSAGTRTALEIFVKKSKGDPDRGSVFAEERLRNLLIRLHFGKLSDY